MRIAAEQPLLGELACLGIVYDRRSHGFAIAARLRPDGDIGRIWSLSRPLTYRALDQLVSAGLVAEVGVEPGRAGGSRTMLAATRSGRALFRRWAATPALHLRDLRSELLLKLVLASEHGLDVGVMIAEQRAIVAEIVEALRGPTAGGEGRSTGRFDVVQLWRIESASAALRFLDGLGDRVPSTAG